MRKGRKTLAILTAMAIICGFSITGCNSGKSDSSTVLSNQEGTINKTTTETPASKTVSPAATTTQDTAPTEETAASESPAVSEKSDSNTASSTKTPTSPKQKKTSKEGSGKKNKSPYSLEGTYLGTYSNTNQKTIMVYIDGKKIVLYTEDFKKFQEFNIDTDMDDKTFADTISANFMYEDINFDQFLDLGILTKIDGNNKYYSFYTWNDSKQKFEYNKKASEIVSPMIISNVHEIDSHVEKDEKNFTDYVYKWNKGKRITTSEAAVTYDKNSSKYTIKIKKYDEKTGKLKSSKTKLSDHPY